MPTSQDKNLGKAYNEYAALVKDPEDWICFKDRDVMFLTNDYIDLIPQVIAKNSDIGLFTCLTNRVGNKLQCYQGRISDDPNMKNHHSIAVQLLNKNRMACTYVNKIISGHILIVQKKMWMKIGGAKDGLLGVDNDISKKIIKLGKSIAIMQGLYVLHFYRLNSGHHDKSHLQ